MADSEADQDVIKNQVINLDYQEFENKRLENCKLVYAGGRPPILRGTTIINCEFILEGPALNTANFLTLISHSGDAKLVVQSLLGLKNWKPTDE